MKRNRGGLLITGRRFLALPQRQLLRILNRGKAARVLYLERISCFLILSKYSPRGRYRAYLGPCRCSAMAGSICLLFVWASGGSQPTPGPPCTHRAPTKASQEDEQGEGGGRGAAYPAAICRTPGPSIVPGSSPMPGRGGHSPTLCWAKQGPS